MSTVDNATTRFLPYGKHCIDADDIAAVTSVLQGDRLTTGPTVAAFEEKFALAVGAKHAVACANGTAALHMAMTALDLVPGDAIIVPSITFLATANAARLVGADVVFADVDPNTALMRPSDVKQAVEAAVAGGLRPRGVCPVHFAGQCVDIEGITAIAEQHGLVVIEDACHAVGAKYRDANNELHPVGASRHSRMTTFSFHPVKTIAMGEGGAITTNDEELWQRLQRLRNHGMQSHEPPVFQNPELAYAADGTYNPWYYEISELGFNYRVSDVHCALGLSQLSKLDHFVKRRLEIVKAYDERFVRHSPLIRPLSRVSACKPGWHLYVVLIDFESNSSGRAHIMRTLRSCGIGTQVHYIPLHTQPYYRRRYGTQTLEGAELYYRQALSLPLFPSMTGDDVDRVISTLLTAMEQRRPARTDQ